MHVTPPNSYCKVPQITGRSSILHLRQALPRDAINRPHPYLSKTKMLRAVVIRSARSVVRSGPCIRARVSRPSTASPVVRSTHFAPAASITAVRYYSAPAGLSKNEVEGRIIDLLKNFDKVATYSILEGHGQLLTMLIGFGCFKSKRQRHDNMLRALN